MPCVQFHLPRSGTALADTQARAFTRPCRVPGTMRPHSMLSASCLDTVLLRQLRPCCPAHNHIALRGEHRRAYRPARSIPLRAPFGVTEFILSYCWDYGGSSLSRHLHQTGKRLAIAPRCFFLLLRVSAHSACLIMRHYKTWPVGFPRSPRHNKVMSPSSALLFFKPSALVALRAACSGGSRDAFPSLYHIRTVVLPSLFNPVLCVRSIRGGGCLRAPRALACSTPLQNIAI